MENLLIKSKNKISGVPVKFHRYLYEKINLNNRLIAVLGARGTGKTTLLLQIAKAQKDATVFYVSLDDLFFTENTLYGLAEWFEKTGGNILFLDEVHKYPDWSRELKLIYDDFNSLHVVFTSSSVLDIYKGESDLSRRALKYHLKELSFREYLMFYENIKLPQLSLSEIIANNYTRYKELTENFKPLKYFQDFIKTGAYPYYSGNANEYYQRVQNVITLILDIDIQSITGMEYANIAKMKRLLYVLATNVPFTPNISKLAEKTGINRTLLVEVLYILEKAELIHTAVKKGRSISIMSKPDKIWLHNTTLNYAISNENTEKGNLRETFFIQHIHAENKVTLPDKGDFLINNKYIFEVGGRKKTQKQIEGTENAFVVKDDIEIGALNVLPLWIFGMLY